jgi:oxygen-independent coproporphyrinogen-3 oxidase
MFEKLHAQFLITHDAEITLEVNPGTVTEAKLQAWKQAGINRLSIGVPSLNDILLKKLNRHQTTVDVEYVLSTASLYFENLSVDFIVGLPEVSFQDWKDTVLHAMKWPIKHISVYFLTVHEKTPLYFKVQQNQISLPPDDITVDMYEWLVATLQEHGFIRYEISNFAKPGYESKHNAAYWNRASYKGFGLGACSFNGTYRYRNTKNLNKYLQSQGKYQNLVEEIEALTDQQIVMEKIMLGLRQSRGIDTYDIIYKYTPLQKDKFYQGVELLKQKGLLYQDQSILRLTPQGYALENEVAVRLFP